MAEKKIATREAYGEALAEFGASYDIVVMDADLSKSTKTDTFKKKFPERFLNAGIAEGNMMSVAAGIATTGKTVFASSFAMFAAGRAYEPIRNSIGYPHLNVKIGASHAGISVGEDGATHQCIEDIALMSAIPGMVVLSPADAAETRACVKAAILHDGPVYLRLGRLGVDNIYEKDTIPFELGKGIVLKEGTDVTIVATGLMLHEAIKAADLLAAENISAAVLDIHTIKPIDSELLLKYAKATGAVVTAEEHTIYGGLGSIVSRELADAYPIPVKMVAIEDQFGKSGNAGLLLKEYGLTAEHIVQQAKAAIALKK